MSSLGGHRVGRDIGDQLHVLARRQAGHKVVELKNEPDMISPIEGQIPVLERGQLQVAKPDLARGRMIKPAEDIEQRGLAAAGRPEQHRQLAGVKL